MSLVGRRCRCSLWLVQAGVHLVRVAAAGGVAEARAAITRQAEGTGRRGGRPGVRRFA